jgi:hypothetical protein
MIFSAYRSTFVLSTNAASSASGCRSAFSQADTDEADRGENINQVGDASLAPVRADRDDREQHFIKSTPDRFTLTWGRFRFIKTCSPNG